jgi:hypothetical protein
MNLNSRSFYCLIVCILFYFPLNALAQTSTDANPSLADTITSDFAIAEKIKEAPHDLQLQFEQNPLSLAPEKNEQILNHFSEAYKSELLIKDFKSALQQKLNGEWIETISQKLQTPAIQTITNAQQQFYTLQGKRQGVVTKYEMEQTPPTEERTSTIQALADTTSMASEFVESSIVILRPLLESLMKESQQRTFSEAQLDAITSNFRAQMQSQATNQSSTDLLITFHHVDGEVLRKYVSFMQSQPGQQLNKVISESMRSAYQQAADRFSASVNSDQ